MKAGVLELRGELAGRVTRFRLRAELSQSEVARQMREAGFENWNQMTASRTEKAKRDPSVFELIALANIFGTTIEAMVNFGVEPVFDHTAGLRYAVSVLSRELSEAAA